MSAQNRIKQGVIKILNGATATGAGVPLDVSGYKAITFQLATQGSAAATIKFAISAQASQPNFNIAPSYTNRYSFVQIINDDSGNAIPGSTGIVLAGTDIINNYEVNTNFIIKWFCPIVTAYAAGTLDIDMDAANDYTR